MIKRPGGETPEGMEEDNLVLEEWFKAQGFTEDVEDAFRQLMFESEKI